MKKKSLAAAAVIIFAFISTTIAFPLYNLPTTTIGSLTDLFLVPESVPISQAVEARTLGASSTLQDTNDKLTTRSNRQNLGVVSTRYVATGGSDSGPNNCLLVASPCATIAHAISQAVAGDTISIAAGTYTQPGNVVDKNLTLTGAGAASTIVRAAASPTGEPGRVFTINSLVTASMNNLTIRNGKAPNGTAGSPCTSFPCLPGSDGSVGQAGGGILNNGALTLTNVIMSGNRGGKGGTAGNISCPVGPGTCSNIGGEGGTGGAVYSNGSLPVSLTVVSSTFTNNHAGEPGDAGSTAGCAGTCTSTVGDTGNGGGLAGATVSVTSSIFTENSGDDGGAIQQGAASITITNSTFSENSASNTGGAINCNGSSTNTCSISGTTINNNFTSGTQGGTVAFFGNSAKSISNSTITGNESLGDGGGILADFGTVDITFVTIADNVADANNSGSGDGGGIKNEDATVNLKNSIIADNSDDGGEAHQIFGVITSQGYNHVESTTGGAFAPVTGDVIGSEGGLAPLASNGGPTQTRGLYANSPALDQIPNGTNDCGVAPFNVDQRGLGFPRPVNSACDKGAFEGNLGTAPQEIDVQGGPPLTLVSIPDGDVSPSTTDGTDFGSTSPTGGTVVHTFTIFNSGTQNLVLSNPIITGGNPLDFSVAVTTPPISPIAPGGSATFDVTFDPNALGLRTAIVNIASNDSNENPYDFTIQGTGDAAPTPATLMVDRTDDDITFDDCDTGIPNDCSLRGANSIAQDGDTIMFDPVVFPFQAGGPQTITLVSGEIVIASSISISGPGADRLIIDGGTGSNRIFYIEGTPLNVTISGLSLTGGNGQGAANNGIGGAIYASCQLTLDGMHVFENDAVSGGGVAFVNGGPYTIRNSTINNNAAVAKGGGIDNEKSLGLDQKEINSAISGNTLVRRPLAPKGTNAFGNSNESGGGIFNRGATLSVTDSTISGNTTTFVGGGIENIRFGGDPVTSATVLRSTFSGNTASSGAGIHNQDATLDVNTSTISGNTATNTADPAGGAAGLENVASTQDANATVTNSTFNNNFYADGAVPNADDIHSGNFGSVSTVTLRSTIIGGNVTTAAPNLRVLTDGTIPTPGVITSGGFNLSSDNGSGFLTGIGDIINVDPMLRPLANYGGPTPTHDLLSNSPARDKGCAFGATTDQRGFPRTIDSPNIPNGQCTGLEGTVTLGTDIGSVETLTPTAAPVSISGRVKTADGRGITSVIVTVRDLNGEIVGTARTSTFGFYSIDGVEAGQSYFVAVRSKRFVFQVPSIAISLDDSIEGLDFVASP